MYFGEQVQASADLPEAGEYVAMIRGAVEKPAPWDREAMCLALTLQVGTVTFEDTTGLDNGGRLAAICKACGIQPVGEVAPSELVDRPVGVEVRRKIAKSGKEYATVGRFFEPPPPRLETRVQGAGRSVVRKADVSAGEVDDGDIPF